MHSLYVCYYPFHNSIPNESCPAQLPVSAELAVEASKVVDNFSHVSIDHVNKESLDSTHDCKAQQNLLPYYSQMPVTK